MKPTIPITHPDFKYRSSVNTNVAATWALARKAMAAEQKAAAEQAHVVIDMKRKVKA